MFGYACNETPEMMPLPILLAHNLTRRLAEVRKKNILDFLRPDGKSQVTIQYVNGKAIRWMRWSWPPSTPGSEDRHAPRGLIEEVVKKVVPAGLLDKNTKYYLNATGRFVVGGPRGTAASPAGRSWSIPTAGGQPRRRVLLGQDPPKWTAAARTWPATWPRISSAGLAEKVECKIAYAIGVAQPVSVMIDTGGTWKIPPDDIAKLVREIFDLARVRSSAS